MEADGLHATPPKPHLSGGRNHRLSCTALCGFVPYLLGYLLASRLVQCYKLSGESSIFNHGHLKNLALHKAVIIQTLTKLHNP